MSTPSQEERRAAYLETHGFNNLYGDDRWFRNGTAWKADEAERHCLTGDSFAIMHLLEYGPEPVRHAVAIRVALDLIGAFKKHGLSVSDDDVAKIKAWGLDPKVAASIRLVRDAILSL